MPVASPDYTPSSYQAASASSTSSPYGFAPTVLTAAQIGQYCANAGFKGQALITAIAIALAESSGFTAAHGGYDANGVHYDVWGLFQVSTIHPTAGGYPVNQQTATDPAKNAQMAYELSGGGSNWLPWQTFNGPASEGYNGAYLKYVGQAQQAAQQVAAGGGNITLTAADTTGTPGTTGSVTVIPIQPVDINKYAPTKKGTKYPAVTKVWTVDEIQMELVDASGAALKMAGLKTIPVGGATGTFLYDLLVSVQVSMDNSQSTQVTFVFAQGDVLAANGIGFPAQPDVLISRVIIRDLFLAVSSVSLTADAAGRPQWQVVCISETQMVLMDAFPPILAPSSTGGLATVGMEYAPGGIDTSNLDPLSNSYSPAQSSVTDSSESADDYIARMCKKFSVGPFGLPIPFYAETSNQQTDLDGTVVFSNTTLADQPNTANYGGYNPYGDPASGTLPDSLWLYFQRLSGFFGFWMYESGGALYFAQPSTLVEWGNKLYVNYKGIDNPNPLDGTEPIGTPKLAADIEETPGGYAQVNRRQIVRTIQVDLAPWYGCQAKPGDELVLSGFWSSSKKLSPWDTTPEPPDHWVGVGFGSTPQWPKPGQKYIITSVSFAIDGGLSPVTIKAEEVRDPNPQAAVTAANGTVVATLTQPTGATTTSYVVPSGSGVEAQLSPNWRTARLAADALKLAAAQQGIPYTWGGTNPQTGFDCSGLVYWACTQVGVDPTNQPRKSQQLWATIAAAHTQITVSQALNTPFALLFPADPSSAPSHVAISMGDGHSILQASTTGTPVNVSDIAQNGWLVQAGVLPGLSYRAATAPNVSPDTQAAPAAQ